ncbi:hypothetical protein NEFER02_2209 [Nematocida sp. LUAm2]|nr:hypothetical protein NEFER02_2209 [Nematocida sp. LUAm2]
MERGRKLEDRLYEIELKYNETYNRAVTAAPSWAEQHPEEVREVSTADGSYGKHCKIVGERETFEEGQEVRIAEHESLGKEQESEAGRFYDTGVIMQKCGGDADSYLVRDRKGKIKREHTRT